MSRGLKAERRGRRVPPTPQGIVQVARHRGTNGVVEALISRHNQRWAGVSKISRGLTEPVVSTLHVLFPLDVVLAKSGIEFDAIPSSPFGEWPDHLLWALDSACQTERMILGGNLIGAAAVARTQLERWSANRTASNGLLQADGQSAADFYNEMWSDERPVIDAGTVWSELSEGLHGRGSMVAAARWEACHLPATHGLGDLARTIDLVNTAQQLALRQVLLCVVDLAEGMGFGSARSKILRAMPMALPSEVLIREASRAVWPITWEFTRQFGVAAVSSNDKYLKDVGRLAAQETPRKRGYSARSLDAFQSRRRRATATATLAFKQEALDLGDEFNPASIAERENAYILANETAALLALWRDDEIGDALATASSAMRAALWLWLEDDSRSLVLARTVLEQAARLRVWRTKPKTAEKLEGRAQTTPRDWLEAAGWRRLSLVNRSLAEFSHAKPCVQWWGALEALAKTQAESEGRSEFPLQTVRGNTLNSVVFALGLEVMEWCRLDYPELASALDFVAPEEGLPQQLEMESWMQRSWKHRQTGFDVESGPQWVAPGS